MTAGKPDIQKTPKDSPAEAPEQHPGAEAHATPEGSVSTGWRVMLVIWVVSFGGIFLYDVMETVTRVLRRWFLSG